MISTVAAVFTTPVSPGTLLLAVAAILLYASSRAAADALAGNDPTRPGFRAIGHCIPIGFVAAVCLTPLVSQPGKAFVGGRPDVAVAFLVGGCVACLTLALGIVTYLSPLTVLPASRKTWQFVLPVGLLLLVTGFGGSLGGLNAAMLMLLGIAVLNLWREPPAAEEANILEGTASSTTSTSIWRCTPARVVQLVLAILLAAVGSWAAARGLARVEQTSRVLPSVLVGSALLGPLMTLPVLATVSVIAERGRPGSAVSTLVAIVLINLCLTLPVIVLAHNGMTTLLAAVELNTGAATSQPATQPAIQAGGVPFPMITWRLDTVLLVVIGFAMIPWALGRWTISRVESMALIVAYAVYLGLSAVLSVRFR